MHWLGTIWKITPRKNKIDFDKDTSQFFFIKVVVSDYFPTSIRSLRLRTQPGPHSLGLVLNRLVHLLLVPHRARLSFFSVTGLQEPTSEFFLVAPWWLGASHVVFCAVSTDCSEFASVETD